MCNYTFVFIFLRNSSLHIAKDTLVENHNPYVYVQNVCLLLWADSFCLKKGPQPEQAWQTNSHLPRDVHEQNAECEHSLRTSFIRPRSQYRSNIAAATSSTLRTISLTDEGIAVSQNRGLNMKAFFPPFR